MATVSPKLTLPFTLGAGALLGQGNAPELWVLYSTDNATVATPSWNDATAKLRSFSTFRGRESELADVDASTVQITLDNRTRTFDPSFNSLIRPMNRWWLREQFASETQDLFKGYADSYDLQWPAPIGDAEAVVSCTDEFKVLALDRLPVSAPPRDSYADVVMFDNPTGYWRMDDLASTLVATAVTGPALAAVGTPSNGTPSLDLTTAILGDSGRHLQVTGAVHFFSTVQDGAVGDVSGLGEFTIELWFAFSAAPAATKLIWTGPDQDSANLSWELRILTTGALQLAARNSGGTTVTISSTALSATTWHHVVGTITGGNLRLYVNGVNVASSAWISPTGVLDAGQRHVLGDPAGSGISMAFDEVAFYRYGLSAARIGAHYTAGTARGFPIELPGSRIDGILSASNSQVPRRLDAGLRDVVARYMSGQDPLGEIRVADRADDPDSVFFTARDGTLVYLDGDHRSAAPYNTVQATFDDDGTDLPYVDLDLDYSESFLTNDLNGSRIGGNLLSASDVTSIGRYRVRSQTITDIPVTDDTDAQAVLDAMLAKYKDPMTRITSLTLTTQVPDVAEAIFRRDIGDRIRVFRTPPGGGARIDQTLFIQKIEISAANDGRPWQVRWGVSPL